MFLSFRATIIQQQSSKVARADLGSVALPAVLRAADASGRGSFSESNLQKTQFSQLSRRLHDNGHNLTASSVSY